MKRVTLRQQIEPAEQAKRVAPDGASRTAVRESIAERAPTVGARDEVSV